MSENKKVRTRFAPSPTGDLHIGSLRTALYSYALAKHYNGDFILRIEDTDKAREVEGSLEKLKEILGIFNINWDEYYVQSERVGEGHYKEAAEKLVNDGHAFYCDCKAKNAKSDGYSKELRDPCRDKGLKSGAIKLKVPDKETVAYTDYVLDKKIKWDTSVVADATLLKSDGFPTYHLAVVVDDTAMNITHVLRGHDWMPSTPIHLLVYKYLDLPMPEIGHLTDILDPEGGKLSKRKGSVSCQALFDDGYLPDALLNFVMFLGWAPKDNSEIFTLDEFVKVFDKDGLQKSNPVFNRKKLDWMNGEYIRNMKVDDLQKLFEDRNKDFASMKSEDKKLLTELLQTRVTKINDLDEMIKFFFDTPQNIDNEMFKDNYEEMLKTARDVISSISDWDLDKLNESFMNAIKEKDYKVGKFFMNLRVAVSGQKVTPPINESIIILGKDETVKRIDSVIN